MALSIKRQIEELNELIQLDHDAVGAYTEAIDAVPESALRESLLQFRSDHQRHIFDLFALVRRLGAKPAEAAEQTGGARRTVTRVAGLVGSG